MREVSAGRRKLLPLGMCLIAFPASAQAHSPAPGLGDFWSGALHPLTTPTHVMIILGLGFLCGRRVPLQLRVPMAVFASVSAIALALTTTGWIKVVYPPALIVVALALGVMLALDKDPPQMVLAATFACAALGLGLDSGVESGSSVTTVKTLLGTWISLAVLIVDIAIYVNLGRKFRWLRIAIQIAGSWIVAISLMMLAFYFRK
ncbi:MAG TPA: HupE/UreJ family protein [Verrucomicrobiota bacterium]|nr:HupE/UreJ family protein [Verrucomicrobiota bacterium]